MHSGYKINLSKSLFGKEYAHYKKAGQHHLRGHCENMRKIVSQIEKFIEASNKSSDKMFQKFSFPTIAADVFILCSHADMDCVNALAGWLKENFDLNVFVDANLWNYADASLVSRNNIHSNASETTVNNPIDKCAQNMDFMLMAAVEKIIDDVECVILLEQEESENIYKSSSEAAHTLSPWIFSEIFCSQIIRKKPLAFYREYSYADTCLTAESADMRLSFDIIYDMENGNLIEIDNVHLMQWLKEKKLCESECFYYLDILYQITDSKRFYIEQKRYVPIKKGLANVYEKQNMN